MVRLHSKTSAVYLVIILEVWASLTPPAAACTLPQGPARAVVSVIDGDTLLLDDQTKLRLVGALAPAPPSPGTSDADRPPAAAAKVALQRYVAGQSLLLEFGGRKADRYGTQLAQAFVVDESGSFWLQGRLVEEGLARAYSFPDNHGCAAELVGLEAGARVLGRGLWANSAYAVRDAAKPRELLRYLGSYQLVEGVVADVGASKGRVFLDFGLDWHTDFTASLEPRDRQRFDKAGIGLADLKGRRLRVRGWIESANGPAIRVTHPEQIEIVAADGSARVIGTLVDDAATTEEPASP
jgi:micrococcal nuclease